MERTLVIGASENPERYSNKAVRLLRNHGHEVLAIGAREGYISDVRIETEQVRFENIDTVTMYVGPRNQSDYYKYVASLRPRRVIFNPGTENPEFERELEDSGIEVQEACTLVLLSTGQF
ncbi:MAG: CoA-binding protein [Prolixibacteraceae bacterium]|jgi:predicted CoA-binding protein|nr:CoA-binding protein [Prolixibacteraceae bacterium]